MTLAKLTPVIVAGAFKHRRNYSAFSLGRVFDDSQTIQNTVSVPLFVSPVMPDADAEMTLIHAL